MTALQLNRYKAPASLSIPDTNALKTTPLQLQHRCLFRPRTGAAGAHLREMDEGLGKDLDRRSHVLALCADGGIRGLLRGLISDMNRELPEFRERNGVGGGEDRQEGDERPALHFDGIWVLAKSPKVNLIQKSKSQLEKKEVACASGSMVGTPAHAPL